jgi:hypothetical protein
VEGLFRLFGSSTWWSAVLSIVASIVCKQHGIDLPPIALAAAPLAVGVKEAARRYADGIVESADARGDKAQAIAENMLGALSAHAAATRSPVPDPVEWLKSHEGETDASRFARP